MRSGKRRAIVRGLAGLAALALGAAALGVIALALPSSRGKPVSGDEYARALRALIVAGRAEDENAWPGLEAAHERALALVSQTMHPRVAGALQYGLWRLNAGDWIDPRHDEARATLERLAPVLDDVDGALRGSFCLGPARNGASDAADVVMPAGSSRAHTALARLNAAWMRRCAEHGDWDGFERAFARQMRHGRTIGAATVMSTMLGAGIQGMGVGEALACIMETSPPAEVIDRLAALAREHAAGQEDAVATWDGERLVWLWIARPWFGDTGFMLPDSAGTEPSVWERVANVRAYAAPRWADAVREIDTDAAVLRAWFAASPGQRGAEPRMEAVRRYLFDSLGTTTDPSAQGNPSQRGVSALVRVLVSRAEWVSCFRVEAFRARHGRWPTTLDEASPDEPLVDPVTGAALVYIAPGGGENGEEYAIRRPGDSEGTWLYRRMARRAVEELTESERDMLATPPTPQSASEGR